MSSERFRPYSLSGLLQEGHRLVLDTALGILTQIGEPCVFVQQQHVATEEMVLITELLSAFPYAALDATLLAAKTQRDLRKCQEEVNWAYDNGEWDVVMRPVRNVISRCRLRLHPFDIDVKSIVQTGYILMPLKNGRMN